MLLRSEARNTPEDIDDQAVASSDKCHLLALPAELRNQIYNFVVRKRRGSRENNVWIHAPYWSPKYGYKMPALLQTCRQIRNEAMVLYIERRTFVFDVGSVGKEKVDLYWFEPYIKHMRKLIIRTFPADCIYTLHLQDGLDGYVVEAAGWLDASRCHKSKALLERIVARGKARDERPLLDSAGLRAFFKMLFKDEERARYGSALI